jgi:hypothetical protein
MVECDQSKAIGIALLLLKIPRIRRVDPVIESLNVREDAPTLGMNDYLRVAVFSAVQLASLFLFLIFARSIFTAFFAVRDSFYLYPTPTYLQAVGSFIQHVNRGLPFWGDALRDIPPPLIWVIPLLLGVPFSFFVVTNLRKTKAMYQMRLQYFSDRMTPEKKYFF